MNPLTASKAGGASADISAFRRTYIAGVVTRASLLTLTVVCAVLASMPGPGRSAGSTVLLVSVGVYLLLSWRSMQVSREAMRASIFLARGEMEEAERVLRASLRRFSLFPGHRVVELYHLAVLRQGQGRYGEAAELSQAVITAQTGAAARARFKRAHPGLGEAAGVGEAGVGVAGALVRIECLLELGDVRGAYEAMVPVTGRVLPLQESVRLLASRTRYEVMVGANDAVLEGLATKLALTELMPIGPALSTLGRFALAAQGRGRAELARWLATRGVAVGGAERVMEAAPGLADLAREIGAEVEAAVGRGAQVVE